LRQPFVEEEQKQIRKVELSGVVEEGFVKEKETPEKAMKHCKQRRNDVADEEVDVAAAQKKINDFSVPVLYCDDDRWNVNGIESPSKTREDERVNVSETSEAQSKLSGKT
jgi:hypothetical protein